MRLHALALTLCAALGAAGCGYALLGRGVSVDPSIRRVGVPEFKDRTGRAGLDQRITAKVIEELGKRGHFEVVSDTTGVDAVVEGELLSCQEAPVGFDVASATESRAQASRYEVRLVAKVRYAKTGATESIWSNDNFSVSDNYDPGNEAVGLVESDQALDRLATTFARQLVSEMLEGF
jgi:hypothetical protein